MPAAPKNAVIRTTRTRPRSTSILHNIAPTVLRWFDRHQRRLPWRVRKSRYRIWISEIMLQQTQVATVVPFYQRFLARFPSVTSLATADESEVLRLWEGLGYYRRARQLHRAAQIIVEKHGGRCPDEIEEWLALPGVGRYTAGAILSISENRRLPILEANTIRLHCRLLGLRSDPRSAGTLRKLWRSAEDVMPNRRAGDFNQALMEIGSQICLPRNPCCSKCPLRMICLAYREQTIDAIPRKSPRPAVTTVRHVAVIIRRGNKFLMRQSRFGNRWDGLWDVPRFELNRRLRIADLPETIRRDSGLTVSLGNPRFTIRHSVTRYRIELRCLVATRVIGTLQRRRGTGWRWVRLPALGQLPLSITARRIVDRLSGEIRSTA